MKDFVHKHGYVEHSAGARVYLHNVQKYNWRSETGKKNYDALSEYKFSVNYTIQGYCSFLLYESMVPFFKDVKEQGLDIELITTIYDSVFLKVHKSIDPTLVADLLRKHFVTDLGNVMIDIDAFMSPNGCWGNYEEISLNK